MDEYVALQRWWASLHMSFQPRAAAVSSVAAVAMEGGKWGQCSSLGDLTVMANPFLQCWGGRQRTGHVQGNFGGVWGQLEDCRHPNIVWGFGKLAG